MAWNGGVLAGIGTVADPRQLHEDMHAYLAGKVVKLCRAAFLRWTVHSDVWCLLQCCSLCAAA